MSDMAHQHQAYCRQLLLDCDHPIFEGPLFRSKDGGPTKKMRDLASDNSEDAVTWSVFRLMERHFADQPWVPALLALAGCDVAVSDLAQVAFWEKGYPPNLRLVWLLDHIDHPRITGSQGARHNPQRLQIVRQNLADYRQRVQNGQTQGKYKWILEGPTEFDAVIRCPGLLVTVEAKLYSDIATEVTWDNGRDQIARVIEAGLALAGDDDFAFLLITDRRRHNPPKKYERLMAHYRSSPPYGLFANRLGWLTWEQIYGWLDSRRACCTIDQVNRMDGLKSYLVKRGFLEV